MIDAGDRVEYTSNQLSVITKLPRVVTPKAGVKGKRTGTLWSLYMAFGHPNSVRL
jgi:hypothetical protein